MTGLFRIPFKDWFGTLQIAGMLLVGTFVLIALVVRRRAKLKEFHIAGIQIIPRRITPHEVLTRARRLSLNPEPIGVRIALDLVEEVLKEDPVNVEAIALRHTLRGALAKFGPFEVKIDWFVHAQAIKVIAALMLIMGVVDLVTRGLRPLLETLALYPGTALAAWLVSTLVHEYGHFAAIRRILIQERGIVIPRMAFFSFVDFGDSLTPKGILRLIFLFKADDTKINVDEVVRTALDERVRMQNQHARIEEWLRDKPQNT